MAAWCEVTRHFTLFLVSSSLYRMFNIENRRRMPIGIWHFFCYPHRHVPYLNVMCYLQHTTVSTSLSPSNPFSLFNASTPLHRQWCQTSVYIIILMFYSHRMTFPVTAGKTAPGQVTKRWIETHLVPHGSTHFTHLGSTHCTHLVTTRPDPPCLCRRANTYTEVDPYMSAFF